MKTFTKMMAIPAIALFLILGGCAKESVVPGNDEITPAADGGNYELPPLCGGATFDLIDGNNTTGTPDYGSVFAGNDANNLFVLTTLGNSWYTNHVYVYYGPTNGIPLNIFGNVDLPNFPHQSTYNPWGNADLTIVPLNGISGCNTLVVAADIFNVDFFGNIISQRTVFLTGPPYANNWPGQYCIANCNLDVNIGGCALVLDGAPGRDCSTLTATVAGNGGPYSYAWSNGATTASITVCPTATTTYSVTVSDAGASSGNQSFTVNYLDIHCGNGNKVTYCRVLNNGNTLEQCLNPAQAANYFAAGNGHYGPCNLVDPCN
jgi:hypothetical protein